MDAYFLEWANLLLRWLHVITAIAWIGSSFYFVFLDNNLQRPQSPDLLVQVVVVVVKIMVMVVMVVQE